MKALTFIAGAAVGYVLGTKAGRERYEQIVTGARNFKDQPVVNQAQERAKDLVDAGTRAVKSKFGDDSSDMNTLDTTATTTRTPRKTTSTGSAATGQI